MVPFFIYILQEKYVKICKKVYFDAITSNVHDGTKSFVRLQSLVQNIYSNLPLYRKGIQLFPGMPAVMQLLEIFDNNQYDINIIFLHFTFKITMCRRKP